MEDTHICENEEGAFEIKYNPAGDELLYSRYGGASGRYMEYFLTHVQEGENE
jgi:hypothetical protein